MEVADRLGPIVQARRIFEVDEIIGLRVDANGVEEVIGGPPNRTFADPADVLAVAENLAEAAGLTVMKWVKRGQDALDHYEFRDSRFFALV